jgi:hypothetical protein
MRSQEICTVVHKGFLSDEAAKLMKLRTTTTKLLNSPTSQNNFCSPQIRPPETIEVRRTRSSLPLVF